MVKIDDIADFPNQPGQRPAPGAPTDVVPIPLVLVTAPLDAEYRNMALNVAAVDSFIEAELAEDRGYAIEVERWSPWSAVQVELPIQTAAPFNYGRFTIGGRHWYAFLSAEYLNLHTSRYRVQGDEWTTYGPSLGYSVIERGHIAVAASQSDTYGANYLTAPEPIDAPPVQGVLSATLLGSAPSSWTVLVISANDLRGHGSEHFWTLHTEALFIAGANNTATAATIDSHGVPQADIPAATYPWESGTLDGGPAVYVPYVYASEGSTIDGVNAGGGAYLFTMRGFAQYMTIMQGAPWITSGITDVRLIPDWAVSGGGDHAFSPVVPSLDPLDGMWAEAAGIPEYVANVVSSTASANVLDEWRDTVLAEFNAEIFRKLVTAPFTQILVGNGEGANTYAPDQWHTSGLGFQAATGAAHGEPSIHLNPTGYNDLGSQLGIDSPVGGKAGIMHSGFGQAASNTATTDLTPYLSAFSSFQTWATNNKNRELAVTLGLTEVQLNAGFVGIVTALTGAASAGGGALGHLDGKAAGKAGVAAAALGGASLAGNLATAQINANNTITMLDISTDGSFDIGAFQLALSGQASVASFDTWWQSLFSNSGGGSPEGLASGWRAILQQAFQAIIVMPSAERIRKLVSEWTRYGYMIGQAFVPPQLNVMSHYSYWQANEPTILGSLPQSARDSISAAFERGVTVWDSVAEIGTQPTNTPLGGISY